MLTALMVWGTLAKGYPICYAHTKLMEPRTSQAVLSSFLNHIPLSASFLPKYVPLKYVCIYVCSHIGEGAKDLTGASFVKH